MTTEPKYFESLYPVNAWDNELEKVVSYIKEGNSSQIVGLPGVGRSNVLGLLAYNHNVRLRHFPKHHGIVHFVMVNFSEVRNRPHTDVIKFIFLCLGNSLREREMAEEYEKVDALFKKALSYNDELVLSQYVKNAVEYLAIEKKLTLVFLFEKFDDYIPQVIDDFFTFLRSLRDKAKYRLSVVFSLARSLDDVLEPQILADFSDFVVGHSIYLPLLDQPSVDFRTGYLEKLVGKKLSSEVKKEVTVLTGGHMRLLMISLEALLAADAMPEDLPEYLLSQKTIQTALQSIWKGFTPSEQADIVDSTLTSSESDYLEKIGIVKDGKLSLPLFQRGIKLRLFKENEAKFIYDEATNTIKRGESTFSDSLTKGEFRLLRYLIQHSDEVVERETIVGVVWKEDKSSLGITDQAIDQLIFRLRQKIEEDPNTPLHLHTIKGRGIKFSQ